MSRRLAYVVVVIVVYVCVYNVYKDSRLTHRSHSHRIGLQGMAVSTVSSQPVDKASVGRRPDDGVWYNFSVPPALLLFSYSAFVDIRIRVIRVIALSTKWEEQQQRNITLYCVYNYKGRRQTTVSRLATEPSPIGMGYSLYGITVREYIYSCSLMYNDSWPISLSISTSPRRQSAAMPVEVPIIDDTRRLLAICVQLAYRRLDPIRLIEWFEFQRLLGVSLIGVYLAPDISQPARMVLRHYADVDGLVDLRRSDYISHVVGGTLTSPQQYMLHWSPVINDCLYRHMFRFRHIGVIDFDEVFMLAVRAERSTEACNHIIACVAPSTRPSLRSPMNNSRYL